MCNKKGQKRARESNVTKSEVATLGNRKQADTRYNVGEKYMTRSGNGRKTADFDLSGPRPLLIHNPATEAKGQGQLEPADVLLVRSQLACSNVSPSQVSIDVVSILAGKGKEG